MIGSPACKISIEAHEKNLVTWLRLSDLTSAVPGVSQEQCSMRADLLNSV